MTSKIELGKFQELIVVKQTDFGVFLNTPTGAEQDKILLPKAHVPQGTQLKDVLNVFVYKDSEDRPIATTLEPDITLGGVARLYVKDAVLVTIYIDKSDRLCASMKVYESLRSDSSYQKDDEVFGRVYEISENFGVFIAVDDMYSALLPHKEVFETYRINQPVYARVAQVLEDGRLTLSVRKKIPEQMNEDAEVIYDCLETAGGFLPYHDKSDPEVIKREFHMSKNAFKRAIGHLQKAGRIKIESNGIRMLS